MLRIGTFTLAVTVWAVPLSAQVNIERVRVADRGPLGVTLGVGARWRTGNVDAFSLDGSLRADFDRDLVHAFVIGSGAFAWLSGQQYVGQSLVHARQVWRPRARVQVETFGQFNHDRSQLLGGRVLGGAGVRIVVISTARADVSVGSSYMLEREWLDLPAGATHPPQTTHHRWSNYVAARVAVSVHAALAWTGYIQPRFDAPHDTRVLSEATLATSVIGRVSLTTTFLLRYDGVPPDGIDPLDTTLRSGVAIEF